MSLRIGFVSAELSPLAQPEPEYAPRRRSVFWAIAVLLIGVAAAYAGWRWVKYPSDPIPEWLMPAKAWIEERITNVRTTSSSSFLAHPSSCDS